MKKLVISAILMVPIMLLYPSGAGAKKPTKEEIAQHLPEGAKIHAMETKMVGGQEHTFVKFEDRDGKMGSQAFKGKKPVSDQQVPKPKKRWISEELQALLDRVEPGEKIKVEVGILVETIDDEGDAVSGTIKVEEEEEEPEITLNGRRSSAQEMLEDAARRVEANKEKAKKNRERANGRIDKISRAHNLRGLRGIQEAIENEDSTVVLELNKGQINALAAQSKKEIQGIHLWHQPEDTIWNAMTSTYINPYALYADGRRGRGIGIYFTECGCPPNGFINNYRRLGGTNSNHSRNVSGIMRAISPESYIYCKTSGSYCGTPILPNAIERAGVGGPPVYIINRSNGQSASSAYNTLDRDWDNYTYNHAISVFVSPGNSGGHLGSPSKGLNTISTGAYDDSTNAIALFSAYRQSQIGNAKPEMSAPGVSVNAGGFTMSGTSMSSPHAAAFSADLMGYRAWFKYKPYLLKAMLIASAWRSISGGFDKVGTGGIDFYGAAYRHYYHWWQGGNGSFSSFDASDPLPNNGYVDSKWVKIPAGRKVRIVLVWLNRGSYTYSHRLDAHPIGMDLDLRVYSPTGAYVAGSFSFDNPFEWVQFTAPTSGVYRVAIKRYANRDTYSKLHMGLIYEWR
jgi:hypothetical protein